MGLDHLGEQRLERPLSQVPLEGPEAHALVIEIPGQAGEAIRGTRVGLEASRQCEAAVRQGLLEDRWRGNRASGEQRRPSVQTDHAIAVATLAPLKPFDR